MAYQFSQQFTYFASTDFVCVEIMPGLLFETPLVSIDGYFVNKVSVIFNKSSYIDEISCVDI